MSSPSPTLVVRRDMPAPPGMERVFCAYRIPYLPALLPPRQGDEQSATELARDMLRAQTVLIAALGRWQEQAFALRYLWRPDSRAVEMAVVLRVLAPQGQATALAGDMGRDLAQHLAAAGITAEPVVTEAEVLGLLNPPGHIYIAEVRQQEEVVTLHAGGAYAVYPFRPPLSTWLPVLEQVVRQPAPCAINVHLQPSRLWPTEQAVFGEAAGLAHALEDFRFGGYSAVEQSDPLATVVGDLYADYLRRLHEPFLVVVQVASPDHRVVQAITSVLAPELSETVAIRTAKARGGLPAGAQVVIPRTPPDAALAQQTLTLLELQPWGDAASRPEQRRLPRLMDAATAAAAFRFPVAADGHIPGIVTRLIVPGTGGRPIGKIFLSYRRGDSAGTTGRIYDWLKARYGQDAVFMDVSNMPLGVDFMDHIQRAIRASAVQLVLIGPNWLDITGDDGRRRLELPQDAVRQEVESGLASGTLVIPVLLDGTGMPARDRLPESLQPLLARNSQNVRHMDFDHDMAVLIEAIDERLRQGAP